LGNAVVKLSSFTIGSNGPHALKTQSSEHKKQIVIFFAKLACQRTARLLYTE